MRRALWTPATLLDSTQRIKLDAAEPEIPYFFYAYITHNATVCYAVLWLCFLFYFQTCCQTLMWKNQWSRVKIRRE